MLASPTWAARALLISIDDVGSATDPPAPTIIRWNFRVAYQGSDVAGTVQKANLTIAVSSSTTPLQIQTAIVTAIQNEATVRGFTVPAGNTLMPTYGNQ